jgi:hypothetical protein
MTNPADGRTPQARRIALIEAPGNSSAGDDRSKRAMQLLDTMLWVLKGTTRAAWTKSGLDEADIVVVHKGDDLGRTAEWLASGKLVVEIAENADEAEGNPNTLVYPFRAVDVLALLERLGTQLDSGSRAPQAAVELPTDATGIAPFKFVDTLRTVRDVPNADLWLVAHHGGTPVLWLRGDGSSYQANPKYVEALSAGTLKLSGLQIRREDKAAADLAQRPGFELGWYAGYHASAIIAPWLSAQTRYKLKSWPNFGLIRPHPSLLRIASALGSTPLTLQQVAARAKVPMEVAARTLNALSACDALVSVAEATAPVSRPKAVAEPSGGFSRFLTRVRKHLGLEQVS